jgi:hypothetical protein
LGLRISGRECNPVGGLAIETDLESILSGTRKGNVEHEHCPGFDIYHSSRWLTELHRALATQQLGAAVVHEANSYGMNPDFGASATNAEYQMGAGVDRGEVREPNVLEHPQHAELALLIYEGVIRDDRKVEVQGSGDSDRRDDVVLLDLVYDIHAFGDLAEHGMDLVQMGLRRVGDEELTSARVLPRVGHRESSRRVLMGVEVGLAFDLVARSSGSDAGISELLRERITALDHEVGDNAVEAGSIIELAVRQLLEIADRARHFGVV